MSFDFNDALIHNPEYSNYLNKTLEAVSKRFFFHRCRMYDFFPFLSSEHKIEKKSADLKKSSQHISLQSPGSALKCKRLKLEKIPRLDKVQLNPSIIAEPAEYQLPLCTASAHWNSPYNSPENFLFSSRTEYTIFSHPRSELKIFRNSSPKKMF